MSRLAAIRVQTVLVLCWSLFTTLFLLVVSALIFRQPNFPLNLGLIQTTGLPGLWATLVPGCLCLGAVLLLGSRHRVGAGLLGVYSLFWLVNLLGSLPVVWNARQSFCINSIGFCITSPWLGRLAVLVLALPFLFVSLWSRREIARPAGRAH